MPRPYVVGLTGGIAAGKSTVLKTLSRLGAETIDADKLGHACYDRSTDAGKKTIVQLGEIFGRDAVIADDGGINRKALGAIVFSAKSEMKKLTDCLWPTIREMFLQRVAEVEKREAHAKRRPIVVLEAAVLLEAGWDKDVDETWAVLTPVETAVQRLAERNGLDRDAAMARISSQLSNSERCLRANRVFWSVAEKHDTADLVNDAVAALEPRLLAAADGTNSSSAAAAGSIATLSPSFATPVPAVLRAAWLQLISARDNKGKESAGEGTLEGVGAGGIELETLCNQFQQLLATRMATASTSSSLSSTSAYKPATIESLGAALKAYDIITCSLRPSQDNGVIARAALLFRGMGREAEEGKFGPSPAASARLWSDFAKAVRQLDDSSLSITPPFSSDAAGVVEAALRENDAEVELELHQLLREVREKAAL